MIVTATEVTKSYSAMSNIMIFPFTFKMVTQIMGFFLHWVPAHAIDTVLRLLGHKPFLVKVAGKVQAGIESLVYFTTHEWIWDGFINQAYLI